MKKEPEKSQKKLANTPQNTLKVDEKQMRKLLKSLEENYFREVIPFLEFDTKMPSQEVKRTFIKTYLITN